MLGGWVETERLGSVGKVWAICSGVQSIVFCGSAVLRRAVGALLRPGCSGFIVPCSSLMYRCGAT